MYAKSTKTITIDLQDYEAINLLEFLKSSTMPAEFEGSYIESDVNHFETVLKYQLEKMKTEVHKDCSILYALTPYSVNVDELAYSYIEHNLDIRYKNGNIYRWFDIETVNIRQIIDNPGKYISQNIKGNYRFAKIDNYESYLSKK